ncbi:MAG: YggS family pyridoxal phosphate-dependent enzyme [Methylophilaceae bacterium]|nr:YggS family pyridoxal phosphate-dependent enzyme [Methylophilaceae bacterium]
MTTIAERLQAVQAYIRAAEHKAGRQTNAVTLLAVSKAQPAALLREAYAAGQRLFGENYLQEALNKQATLTDLAIEWHFIGPIQSNKTQLIAQNFAWVHGVDRLKIAERLNTARPEHLPPLQVCIQVNVSQEASKSGVLAEGLGLLASQIALLPRLKLRGLMAIPAPRSNNIQQHEPFKLVHELQLKLIQQGLALDTLSMGMSGDFSAAIAEGATIVRIGTAIFGARTSNTSELTQPNWTEI